ncbi:MAG TPA: lytic murein transglycosylase [Vicinamibacterales bacterium]|jgi:membrane-bound lytic murein transglycosylase B|nr:lytic murein transglycosylase [Vicinamibacterales bacterium]
MRTSALQRLAIASLVCAAAGSILIAQSPAAVPAVQGSPATPSSSSTTPSGSSATPSSSSTQAGQDAQVQRPSFADWLAGVKAEALSRGIRTDIVESALGSVTEPLDVVIERDRSQAETVLPLETYIARQLTASRIRTGREMYRRHRTLLEKIAAHYQVPSRLLVSIWGAESNFGRFSGVRPTIDALATLAWDPRRSTLFRGELFNALDILNRGDIDLAGMRGSWAGAMGQVQFMPSSYLNFAEDFDGDGRRDIWSSQADVFASIANYIKGNGWTSGQLWGREVKVSPAARKRIDAEVGRRTPSGGCRAAREMSAILPLAKWNELGVRTTAGRALPAADVNASLISGATRHFLAYSNYDVVLAYNCAHAYALGVTLFSDQIR